MTRAKDREMAARRPTEVQKEEKARENEPDCTRGADKQKEDGERE